MLHPQFFPGSSTCLLNACVCHPGLCVCHIQQALAQDQSHKYRCFYLNDGIGVTSNLCQKNRQLPIFPQCWNLLNNNNPTSNINFVGFNLPSTTKFSWKPWVFGNIGCFIPILIINIKSQITHSTPKHNTSLYGGSSGWVTWWWGQYAFHILVLGCSSFCSPRWGSSIWCDW
jgi:hypothetical protein